MLVTHAITWQVCCHPFADKSWQLCPLCHQLGHNTSSSFDTMSGGHHQIRPRNPDAAAHCTSAIASALLLSTIQCSVHAAELQRVADMDGSLGDNMTGVYAKHNVCCRKQMLQRGSAVCHYAFPAICECMAATLLQCDSVIERLGWISLTTG